MHDDDDESVSRPLADEVIDAEFEDEEPGDRSQGSGVSEAGDAAPPLTPDARPLTPDVSMPSDLSSPEERRALAQLGRLIGCDIRPRALLRLARHGPANVGDLARALGFNAANLGDHLGQMSDLGLLFRNRDGKYHRFEINPARVRCGRMGGGAGGAEDGDPPEDFLRINSRPGGLAMIIVMPATQHRVPASSEEKNAV